MIELRQIHKSFAGTEVIKGLSLLINKGETVVLLGLSGSGKTTTLKLINGLEKPNSGTVHFQGQNINDQSLLVLRRQMGYVIQKGGLFPHYNVYSNIAIVPRLLGWNDTQVDTRVRELLDQLNLPHEFVSKYPEQLSGGQQQRVGLARALAGNPPVLLMDEPFGALDPITRKSVRKEFLQLEELNEKTIVLVTHDVQEAFEMGDRIVLMQDGSIIQDGSPGEILQHPANSFVKDFIQADLLTLQLKEAGIYARLNTQLTEGKLSVEDLKKMAND